MGKKNVVFTKDGMRVGVKQVKNENYVDATQNYVVKAWNLGQAQEQEQQYVFNGIETYLSFFGAAGAYSDFSRLGQEREISFPSPHTSRPIRSRKTLSTELLLQAAKFFTKNSSKRQLKNRKW